MKFTFVKVGNRYELEGFNHFFIRYNVLKKMIKHNVPECLIDQQFKLLKASLKDVEKFLKDYENL